MSQGSAPAGSTAGQPQAPAPLVLVRHGETTWARDGRHTGRTDIPLTPLGEAQARAVGGVLGDLSPRRILVSPLQRAWRTAEFAGLVPYEVEEGLAERDYGEVEGITSAAWQQDHPGWTSWTGEMPGGESLDAFADRMDAVLARVRSLVDAGGPVVLVAHAHSLRLLTARWLGLPPEAGALFRLEPATVSRLGFEHQRPVLLTWNVQPPALP